MSCYWDFWHDSLGNYVLGRGKSNKANISLIKPKHNQKLRKNLHILVENYEKMVHFRWKIIKSYRFWLKTKKKVGRLHKN